MEGSVNHAGAIPKIDWEFVTPEDESYLQVRFIAEGGGMQCGGEWPLPPNPTAKDVLVVAFSALSKIGYFIPLAHVDRFGKRSGAAKYTDAQRDLSLLAMAQAYRTGQTLREIAHWCGLSHSATRANLVRLGVEMRPRSPRGKLGRIPVCSVL
jgi:hypothetical protein